MTNLANINNIINEELNEVELMLKDIGKSFTVNSTKEIFNHFFRIPGKYLRPTLVLLSAKTVNPELTLEQREQLIKLSIAIELIHSASLIHDDIIDDDLMRRGQRTLNYVYGRKIAVLAGDALYAKAFSILSRSLPRKAEEVITQVIEKMCTSEIIQSQYTSEILQSQCTSEMIQASDTEQPRNNKVLQQRYLDIIEGKTAVFMSACCRLGATLAGAIKEDITALESYGLNFGMVYQIVDDCMDGDLDQIRGVTIDDAEDFAIKARTSIERFKSSDSRQRLLSLLDYVLSFSKSEIS